MNILIIGSEGFIGGHCVKYFSSKGFVVYGCDLLNTPSHKYNYIKVSRLQPSYTKIFSDHIFDIVLCAGGSGSVPLSFNSPIMDFEANVADIYLIHQIIKDQQPKCKIINLSSAAVYGNPESLPINENSKIAPLSPYGWNKYMSELVSKEFHDLFEIKTCSVRPFSVYGPGLKKQIVWDLYQKLKENPDKVEIFGTGEETRDFVYIDDFVRAIDSIIQYANFEGEVYNIASGVQISIKNLCNLMLSKTNYGGTLEFNNIERIGDPKCWHADITKIERLNYIPQVNFETGLLYTIEWLKKNS